MNRIFYHIISFSTLLLLIACGNLKAQDTIFSKLQNENLISLSNKGNMFMKIGEKDSAMLYYMIAISKNINENKKEKNAYGNILNEIGKIYYYDGIYNKAMEYFVKGEIFGEKNNIDPDILSKIYNNLGTIYTIFSDSTNSVEYYKKSLKLAQNEDNIEQEIITLQNLANFYYRQNDYDTGNIYNEKMIKFKNYDISVNFYLLLNKSLNEVNKSNFDQAIAYISEAKEYAVKNKLQPMTVASAYSLLSDFHERKGDDAASLKYLKKSLEVAENNNIIYMSRNIADVLSKRYESYGNEKEALKYKIKYWTITDSIFNNIEFNKMQNIKFYYELDSKSEEIQKINSDMELKEKQLKDARIRFVSLLSVFVLCIMFIIILYRQKKKINDTYKDLFLKNKELLKAEQESRKERNDFLNLLAHEREMNLLLLKQINESSQDIQAKDTDIKDENIKLYSVDKISDDKKEIILKKISHIMENTKDFCDCGFTLDKLSKTVGSNTRYVSHIIHEKYNKSFPSFLNEYRIKEAQMRLLDTENYGNYTIKTIAESVGYKSLSGFITIFKSYTGISPAIYQKMASQNKA